MAKSAKTKPKRTVAGSKKTAEIALILYPHVQQSAVSGLSDLFEIADRLARERLGSEVPLLRISHLSGWDRVDGFTRTYQTSSHGNLEPSVLVLPPTLQAPSPKSASPALIEYLKSRHKAGTILASVCLGAFLLAESGLLAGRTVTTHWLDAFNMSLNSAAAIEFPTVESVNGRLPDECLNATWFRRLADARNKITW